MIEPERKIGGFKEAKGEERWREIWKKKK